jgi:hypothetical protein
MADLAESGEVADGVNDVVGSFALRLVDDESAVEGGGLWLAGHFSTWQDAVFSDASDETAHSKKISERVIQWCHHEN